MDLHLRCELGQIRRIREPLPQNRARAIHPEPLARRFRRAVAQRLHKHLHCEAFDRQRGERVRRPQLLLQPQPELQATGMLKKHPPACTDSGVRQPLLERRQNFEIQQLSAALEEAVRVRLTRRVQNHLTGRAIPCARSVMLHVSAAQKQRKIRRFMRVPQVHPTYTLHASDSFAWNPAFDGGRHQFKFGFDYRYYWYSILFDTTARGIWTFNGGPANNPLNPNRSALVQLLLGTPDVGQGVNTGVDMDIRAPSYNAYVQDDYRVSPKLTLNLGLRWELNVPPYEVNNHFSVPDFSSNSVTCTPRPACMFIPVGTQGVPRGAYNAYYKNFDPRIGFAWRPFKSDRLVVRSAYGIFTDIIIVNSNLNLRFNPPFRTTLTIQNPTNSATIQNILNQPPATTLPTGTFFDSNFRDAYVQQWNFDVQYALRSDLLLDTAYVGTRGVHLSGNRNLNQPAPGQPAPYPQFGPTMNLIDDNHDSDYNSLQVKLEKRSSKGGAFLTAYTWSRCIDDVSGGIGGGATPQYAQDLKNERGLCSFNANQRLVFSYVYELPIGVGSGFLNHGIAGQILGHWQVSGIFSTQTGQPFTVNRGVPQSGTLPTGTSDRPNVVGDPLVAGAIAGNAACVAPAAVGVPSAWINKCAFAAAPGQFGNTGRNALLSPGYTNQDFSLLKDVRFRESQRIEFRAEAFNLLNHPNFDPPNHNFDSAAFGQIQSANAYGGRPPRQIQLGLKYIF